MSKAKPSRVAQSVYPEAKERFGLEAKKATQYMVPIPTLSMLLAVPTFVLTAYFLIINYATTLSTTALAAERVAFITGLMVFGVVGLFMLYHARRIIVRNCAHPTLVQLLYAVVVLPVSFASLGVLQSMYVATELTVLLIYQAVVVYAISLLLSFLAWSSSQQ